MTSNYRVQTELHTAVCAQVDNESAWYTIRMQPNSSNHNQLFPNHMSRMGVPKTNKPVQVLLPFSGWKLAVMVLEFCFASLNDVKRTDLGTGGGCTLILSQEKPLSFGLNTAVSPSGTPLLSTPPNSTRPP